MARPWITANDLSKFSNHKEVIETNSVRTTVLISIAESKIINYCNHDFSDTEKYPSIPEDVKNATLLLADALIYNDNLQNNVSIKSQTFDDYSYTAEESAVLIDFDSLGIKSLLDKYILDEAHGNMYIGVDVL